MVDHLTNGLEDVAPRLIALRLLLGSERSIEVITCIPIGEFLRGVVVVVLQSPVGRGLAQRAYRRNSQGLAAIGWIKEVIQAAAAGDILELRAAGDER